MGLPAEKYERLKSLLAEADSGARQLSPHVRSAAEDAIRAYDSEHGGGELSSLARNRLAMAAVPREGPDPGPLVTGAVPRQKRPVPGGVASEHPEAAGVTQLVSHLQPELPLVPQALATQPATAHPKGDKAAKDEWIRGDIENPNGLVIVYDAPVAQARKELIENPELLGAIGFGDRMSHDLTQMEPGDVIHQAYNDYKWRQYADTAVKKGKTPYRYSRAPWLKDGKGGQVLSTLSTKLKTSVLPAIETATGVVMGLDDANFGIGRAAADAGLLDDEGPGFPRRETAVPGAVRIGGGKDEIIGGVSVAANDTSTAEAFDMLSEEHPVARTVGQVAGTAGDLPAMAVRGGAKLAGKAASKVAEPVAKGLDEIASWMPSNALWNAIVGAGAKSKAPALLAGPASAAIAGTVHQGVSEAARAGANLIGTGETGTTARDFGDRMGEATLNALGWSLPGTLLTAPARTHANWVRTGTRYERAPERLENLGAEVKFGKGPVLPKVAEEAVESARTRAGGGVQPIDVLAEQLEQPLAKAAKTHDQAARTRVKLVQDEVYKSPEGKARLPAQRLVEESVGLMRQRTASIRGRPPTAVGVPNAQNRVRGILNTNIDGISLEPAPGAIPITLNEFQSFLSPRWQERTVNAARNGARVASRGRALTRRAAEQAADVGEETSEAIARDEPIRLRRPAQLEGGSGGIERVRPARRGRDQLPEGRGELSTEVDDFPHMRDPRDFPPAAKEAPPDVSERAPKERRGARWRRREVVEGEPVPPRGEAKGAKAPRKPRASARERPRAVDPVAELRSRGIKKVYLLPRRYNARHHESAIQMLRQRSEDPAMAKDRDLKKLYQAALEDRDARPWRGVAGGWSALQRQNEAELRAAKDVRRRVSPNVPDGTYRQVTRIAKQGKGQSKTLDAMEMMAARAGVTEAFRGARALDPYDQLQQMISFGKNARGDKRGLLSPTAMLDAVNVRGVYPITRKVGGVRGEQAGRLGLLGEDDDIEARRRARDEKTKAESAPAERGEGGKKRFEKRAKKKFRRRTE